MKTARSSVSRILSASAASWVRIGVTVVTQIGLVALYLQAADDIKKIRGLMVWLIANMRNVFLAFLVEAIVFPYKSIRFNRILMISDI
jgi:hypothetical protein